MSAPLVRLDDVLRRCIRSAPVCSTSAYQMIGVKWYGQGLFTKEMKTGAELASPTVRRVLAGDLVYSRLFAWKQSFAIASTDGWASGEFPTFEIDTDFISPQYLLHALLSDTFTRLVSKSSTGTTTTSRNRLVENVFLGLSIPLPSRADQDRIATHLDSLARTSQPRTVSLASIAQRDWTGRTCQVGDLLTPAIRSESVTDETTYALSGVKWYGQGMFVRETKAGRELSAKTVRRVEVGDLVYNRLFAWKQSFALAVTPAWVSNEFPTFQIDTAQVSPRVLLAALLSPSFTAAVNDASTGSTPTSRNRLKEAVFLDLKVTIPSVEEQPVIERLLLAADRAATLQSRATELATAILPAARNQIFESLS